MQVNNSYIDDTIIRESLIFVDDVNITYYTE